MSSYETEWVSSRIDVRFQHAIAVDIWRGFNVETWCAFNVGIWHALIPRENLTLIQFSFFTNINIYSTSGSHKDSILRHVRYPLGWRCQVFSKFVTLNYHQVWQVLSFCYGAIFRKPWNSVECDKFPRREDSIWYVLFTLFMQWNGEGATFSLLHIEVIYCYRCTNSNVNDVSVRTFGHVFQSYKMAAIYWAWVAGVSPGCRLNTL